MQLLQTLAQTSSVAAGSTGLIFVGIAALLGFLMGSMPRRSEMTGQDFDFPGAVTMAVVAALGAYGVALFFNGGPSFPALGCIGGAALLAALRAYANRPPSAPSGHDLKDGVTYGTGDTPKAKRKSAQRSFSRASFVNGSGRNAARGREWDFGAGGISAEMLTDVLGPSMKTASSDVFAILVLLVSELPDDPRGPGVVVINGTSALRAALVDADGITPSGGSKIASSTIMAVVGYAWR